MVNKRRKRVIKTEIQVSKGIKKTKPQHFPVKNVKLFFECWLRKISIHSW